VAKQQSSLPAYMFEPSSAALRVVSPEPSRPDVPSVAESATKVAPKARAKSTKASRRALPMVELFLKEKTAAKPMSWPDDQPLPRAQKPLQQAAANVVKLSVGAGFLAVSGVQTLVKGWMRSEIWVRNAIVSIALSLVTVQLAVSCLGVLNQVATVQHDKPVVQSLFNKQKAHNQTLKSQITRIQSGEDAELLARDYLDMARPDEVLIKIQTP
jgi:cell division protein FtsB